MNDSITIALPTGRIQNNFFALLNEAGISVTNSARSYRPTLSLPGFDAKILKTQSTVEMLSIGTRDIGVAGYDWVCELNAHVVELLDTELDPVRIVVAAPEGFPTDARYRGRELVIASEYVQLAKRWIESRGLNASVVRSYGTTEAFPPEDADCIVDNTASGATLKASNLVVIDEILKSSTRLFANPRVLDNPAKRDRIEDLVLLLRSVLEARQRVMVEINVSRENLESVASILPCMRTPTISELHKGAGYVVKAAVPKKQLALLIPRIKEVGGCDIVVTTLSNVIP